MLTAMLLIYCNLRLSKENDRLESYLKAIPVWALLLFVATEVLSVFEAMRFLPLLLFWLATDLFLLAVLVVRYRKKKLSFQKFTKTVLPSASPFREKKYFVFLLIGS